MGYIQFTWRLLILATPMLALAGGYSLCEFGGKAAGRGGGRGAVDGGDLRDADFQLSEIQNPIYVEKGVIISPFMGRSFPEYTYSDTTDFPRHPQTLGRNRRGRGDGGLRKAEHDDHSAGERAGGKAESPSRCLITTASARRWTGAEIAVEKRKQQPRERRLARRNKRRAEKLVRRKRMVARRGRGFGGNTDRSALLDEEGEKKACRTH